MADLCFIGVPYWLGRKDDYSGSVDIVKNSGIASDFDAPWMDLAPQFEAYDHPVNAVNAAVAHAIKHAIENQQVPLIIADDCTVCLGNVKGVQQFNPDVLWYDAHGDFNTEETSPSGFLGGMPLAAMVGLGNQNLMTGIDLMPIDDRKIYLTDGRDLDAGEAQLVADSRVTHWQSLQGEHHHEWDNRPLYIHFDGDIIRLEDHPAVGYPATGGPTTDACIASLKHAISHADVKAVHFTCWNATLDGAEQSQKTILSVIRAVAEALR
ncbi:MAG: arginase family protein [Phototrophicaceae bacterium]